MATSDMRNWSRGRRLLLNIGLLGISVLVALGIGELAFRLISPGYSPLFLDIYRLEADGSVGLIPDITRKDAAAEWTVTVTTNAEGMRDRTAPVADAGGTVLGLGDSFAFGWGVELEETYQYRAEELLRPRQIRIVKAGIPGTGTTDQLERLRLLGEQYSPSVVMLSFFVGNDFADVQMGGTRGQFTVRDGLMTKRDLGDHGASASWLWELKEKIKRSSLLAQAAAQVLWYFERTFLSAEERTNPGLNAGDRWLWEFAKIHLSEPPPEALESIEMTLEALDGFHTWSEAHEAPFLLVIIPRSFQVYEWELDQWREAYDLEEGELEVDNPQRVLTEWAAQRNVAVLDLLPHFREHAARHPDERLFFYPNSHMNATGHRFTGELLADRVASLLPPPVSVGHQPDQR